MDFKFIEKLPQINILDYLKTVKISNVFKGIVGLAGVYVVYYTAKIYLVRRRYRHIPGPPTRGILGFYFGHSAHLNEDIKAKSKTHLNELHLEWHKTYGEVYKIFFFDKCMISTINKDSIKEILINKNYPKTEFENVSGFPLNERFVGNGLITEQNNEIWKKRRQVFNHGFHRNILMTFVDQFNIKADILTERFKTFADGKQIINLLDEFNHAALDAIAQIAFGMNVDTINQKDLQLNEAIQIGLKMIQNIFMDPFYRFKPSNRVQINNYKKSMKYLRNVGESIINERFNSLKNHEHVPTDILSSILKNSNSNLEMQVLIDDFITFFAAGQETTANALAFCFYELGRNPNILKRAREEVDKVLGERTEISYQDASDLKYCSAIFKETLRLYPPGAGVFRTNPEDMFINDVRIPKGAYLHINIFVSGRLEQNFKNPLEFNPDRFMRDQSSANSNIENYTYFPFSLGPRNCIGQNFAQLEGVILIAKLAQQFDIKLDPNHKFEVIEEFTLRPKGGTRCTLELRN